MKKFMKVCAIMVAVVFGLGVLLVALGGFGGGFKLVSEQVWRGDLNIENWFPWDFKSGVRYDISEDSTLFDSIHDVIRNVDSYAQDFSGDSVKNLNLDLGGCRVTIGTSPDGDYHVEAKTISSFQAYVSGETLHINAVKNGTWNTNTMVITIKIPAGVRLDNIAMSLGAGDFVFDRLCADEVALEIGAGRLQVDALEAENFNCELGAGQAIITNGVTTGDVTLEVGVGEIRFEGSIPGDLDATCSMGNMEITVIGSTEQDHNMQMDCAAGNLDVGSRSYAGLATEQSIDNGADSDYNLSCAMGNMTLTFK